MVECEHRWAIHGSDTLGWGHCEKCGKRRLAFEIFDELLQKMQDCVQIMNRKENKNDTR